MTEIQTQDRTASIRELNDLLRVKGEGGRTVLSKGVAALSPEDLVSALRGVAAFSAFDQANDPLNEHDCAIFETGSHRVLWKVDYYDLYLNHLSEDPADPAQTHRVLTIMLAEEY